MREINGFSGAHIPLDNTTYLNFAGAGYLGLGALSAVTSAGAKALLDYGAIAQIPQHYGFILPPVRLAEEAACDFFQSEAALYISSGYLFGLAVMHGLKGKVNHIFYDSASHYNLLDGIRAAGIPATPFCHLDAMDLNSRLAQLPASVTPAIVTDALYSTRGEIAPLDLYWKMLKPLHGYLIVDESHSIGVMGPKGQGALSQYAIKDHHIIYGGSLSKGLGAYGGIILASPSIIEELRLTPPIRGGCAGISAGAAMSAAAFRFLSTHPEPLLKIRQLTRMLKQGLASLGFSVENEDIPIASFFLKNRETMLDLQQFLFSQGIYILYSDYIGAGKAGILRCAVFADHDAKDISRLLTQIETYMQTMVS